MLVYDIYLFSLKCQISIFCSKLLNKCDIMLNSKIVILLYLLSIQYKKEFKVVIYMIKISKK